MNKAGTFFMVLICVLGLTTGCDRVSPDHTTVPTTEAVASLTTVATETTVPEPTEYRFPKDAVIKLRTVADVVFTYCWQDENELFYACLDEATGLDVNVWLYDPNVCLYGPPDPECFIDKIKNVQKANYGGEQGAYLNLWEYRDMMPNLFALLDSPEYAHYREIYMPDEETLYMAPVFVNGSTEHSAWMYRGDIFRQLELQVPTDWDSFYGVLKALKAAYPESYPFAMTGFRSGPFSALVDFAQQFGVDYDPEGFAQGPDGVFYDSTVTEEMREMLKKLRQLAEEGLMDPEWLRNDADMCRQALADGTSFITHTKASQLQTIEAAGQEKNEAFSLSWFNNIPLAESELPYTTRTESVKKYGWYINTGFCPDIDLAVRYLDWMYSEEGILTTSWGLEDVSYGVDENGNKYYLDAFAADAENKALLANPCLSGYIDFEATLQDYTPKNRELIRSTVAAAKAGGFHPASEVSFEGKAEVLVDTYLQGYLDARDQYIAQFLLGDRDIHDDTEWQQMLLMLEEGYHAEELLEAFTAAGNAK